MPDRETDRLSLRDMPMNRNVAIGPEELRFVYKLILEGSSDSEILNEYTTLRNRGKPGFPLRTDVGFVRDRRIEMEAASEVLKDSIKRIVQPFVLNQKKRHFAQLAEISTVLLQNDLGRVTESESEAVYGFRSSAVYKPRYTVRDSRSIRVERNSRELVSLLRESIDTACKADVC